jgi:micrococcal nuclease
MADQRNIMRVWVVLVLVSALPLVSSCVEPAASPKSAATTEACWVSYVVDGDTVHLNCGAGEIKARLLGFDTPEVYSPGCKAEKSAGDAATRYLKGLVASGPITKARFDGYDRYGRALVQLQIGGRDVADEMIATGLARPYSGRKHPDWCAILG